MKCGPHQLPEAAPGCFLFSKLKPMPIDLTNAYEQVKTAVLTHCALDDLLREVVPVRASEDVCCVPPNVSGVYFIFRRPADTEKWRLCYIGQVGLAVTIRRRLREHLFSQASSPTNSKSYCITTQTDQFGVAYRIITPDAARLLVEALCIQLLDPPDNQKGKRRERA